MTPGSIVLGLTNVLAMGKKAGTVVRCFKPKATSLSTAKGTAVYGVKTRIKTAASLFPCSRHVNACLGTAKHRRITGVTISMTTSLHTSSRILTGPRGCCSHVVRVSLSLLRPCVGKPFAPSTTAPVSGFTRMIVAGGCPHQVRINLVKSYAGSSCRSLDHTTSLTQRMGRGGLGITSPLVIGPNSRRVHTATRHSNVVTTFRSVNTAVVTGTYKPYVNR